MNQELYEAYCLQHSTTAPDYITETERQSHLKTIAARMLTGPMQGQLLSLISQLLAPTTVVEIGGYTGYSALWLALGLQPDGVVHTIELDEEKAWLIDEAIARANMQHRIVRHIGDAMHIMPQIAAPWDLVYIDADKERYIEYYELAMSSLRIGGVIIADNVLWKGMLPNETPDRITPYLEAFNRHVLADPRSENQILPLRDGLLWAKKKTN